MIDAKRAKELADARSPEIVLAFEKAIAKAARAGKYTLDYTCVSREQVEELDDFAQDYGFTTEFIPFQNVLIVRW